MPIIANTYTFYCTWQTEAKLPEYLGSTLRGAFGWALKRSSCALRLQECSSCMLRTQCAYAWLFETENYTANCGRTINARPHPFVIQPHEGQLEMSRKGDLFSFSMVLLGKGNDYLPHIAHSVKLIGDSGLGSGRKVGCGRFSLDRITQNGEKVYSSADGILHKIESAEEIHLGEKPEEQTTSCRIVLVSPLRVKFANKLYRELPFHILVRTGLRRIASLEDAYNGGEPSLDYIGLTRRAEEVQTAESNLRWQELFRYSNRQKAKVSLGGMTGIVRYTGNLSEFIPILKYCEKVNIGKQTVFGLGKIALEIHGQQSSNAMDNMRTSPTQLIFS